MLKHIKNLLKDKLILLAIAITIVVLGLSLIKMPDTGVSIINIDKVYHGFAYFTLTIVWLLSFYKVPQKKHLITLSCIIFGIIIEVLQKVLTDYRTGEILDVFANSLGSLLALFVFSMIFKKNRLINN
jgi:VanZ family protein